MEEKDINLDNEEEILKVFDFDYCYNSEQCSRELCMFYNDISKQNNNFNERQAFVDLGIIAITLNQQDKRIKELEEENQQLKQQLHDLPKKIVGDVADELGDCGKTYLEDEPYIEICTVKGILQTILKKYGG